LVLIPRPEAGAGITEIKNEKLKCVLGCERFQVLAAVLLEMAIVRDMTLCRRAIIYDV
jgi:hypothetical protein